MKGETSMIEAMLSTKDNPFNPFDDFDAWFQFDMSRGYNTCNVLASRAIVSDGSLPKEDDIESINEAIDEIILEFPDIEFIKVTKEK